MRRRRHGIFPALVTPMGKAEEVDYDTLETIKVRQKNLQTRCVSERGRADGIKAEVDRLAVAAPQ